MSRYHKRGFPVHRRDVLKGGASAVGAAALPSGLVSNAVAATSTTLVIAAPATPQSLDCNFDVSLGTFEAIAALYDNLLEFKKIPDPKQPDARGHRRPPGHARRPCHPG
jgi:peptide/nickel transport system substrate-binding protein